MGVTYRILHPTLSSPLPMSPQIAAPTVAPAPINLAALFPQAEQIPAEFQLTAPIHQREYLINSDLAVCESVDSYRL
jgi:hypothetical protein